jgi:DNA-binding FadR family transcriptional regulator
VRDSSILAQVPELRHGVERRSVKDIICEKLALLIGTGVLQVGDQLPGERELASAFGVSRETVRGAVQALALRGIIDVSHGARSRVVGTDVGALQAGVMPVRGIDHYGIEDVHAARLLVERQVVGDAAHHIGDATLAVLDQSLVEQERARNDPLRFLILDREFHSAIYHAADNELLADFVTDLYAYMMDRRRSAMSRPGAIAESLADHLAIVGALRARDSDAAVAAFDRHIRRIYRSTKTVLGDRKDKRPSRALTAVSQGG